MTLYHRIRSFWQTLFRGRQTERDLDDEVDAYLELLIQRKVERGVEPIEARREALIEFGGKEQVKEKVREARMSHYIETVAQDIQYAVRVLIKNPVFTIIAVTTLALGIGASAAIFSVVNALLFRPLPYASPERLVWIGEVAQDRKEDVVPGAHVLDWIAQSKAFDQITAYNPGDFTLTGTGESEKLDGNRVTANFFSTLGVKVFIGRNFLPADDQPRAEEVAIISHGLWERISNSDRNVIGRTIMLDDQRYTVIGVLPADFRYSERCDVWLPLP